MEDDLNHAPESPAAVPHAPLSGGARGRSLSPRRVPEVTVHFWIIKILSTAMGEATSDYLVHRMDPVIVVAFGGVGLAISLVIQFAMRRYVPWAYWLTVVMVAVSGTMAADVLHIRFGVPYAVSATLFAVLLAAVFWAWHAREKTLSIHSINTTRREVFYWATVMATFALGTATGDMTAITWNIGYFGSAVMFTLLIFVPALAYRFARMNGIFCFWFAYILTRPLGASYADWLGKPRSVGGLALGDWHVSLVLTALIIGFVVFLSARQRGAGKASLASS